MAQLIIIGILAAMNIGFIVWLVNIVNENGKLKKLNTELEKDKNALKIDLKQKANEIKHLQSPSLSVDKLHDRLQNENG